MMMGRVLVVGWDGADWDIIDDLVRRDVLPTVKNMIALGAKGTLESTTPTHSWSAWASFLTGMQPAGHGVFDFVERDPHDPQRRIPVSSDSIRAPWYLEMLATAGRDVRAGNIPVTFPPAPIGRIIAGVAIPPGARFVSPPGFAQELAERAPFPLNGMEWSIMHDRPGELVDEARTFVERRGASFRTLLQGDWETAAVVFVAPDRLQHPFGSALLPSHPAYAVDSDGQIADALREVYRDLDHELARLIDIAGDDATVILMSDHGFRPISRLADIDEILVSIGEAHRGSTGQAARTLRRSAFMRRFGKSRAGQIAKRRIRAPSSFDWSRTRAYRSVAGGLSLNLRGREAGGIVAPQDAAAAAAEIAEELKAYVDPTTGEHPITDLIRRDELAPGPFLDLAPDLMIRPAPLWSLSPTNRRDPRTTWPSGSHRREGIIVASGPDVGVSDLGTRHIVDLAPTILALCDMAAEGMDGTVIQPIVTRSRTPLTVASGAVAPRQPNVMSAGDEDSITQHLRDLGYIE